MAPRHLFITRPRVTGEQNAPCLQVRVDEQAALGPSLMTLAAHLGYPLVDRFGAPLAYRLRSLSGEILLPTTGRFAEARFPSGSHFVLEPDVHRTMPLHPLERATVSSASGGALSSSRRSLLRAGLLTGCSLLGLGAGMTTAFAQHLLAKPLGTTTSLRVQTTFGSHQQAVRALTWSPDGRMLASGGDDGMVLVWQSDGTLVHRLPFTAPVRALAWSPDGAQLLVAWGGTLSFVDARTGEVLAEHTGPHTASVTSLGWTTAQGMLPLALSAGTDRRAVVWDGRSHQPQRVFGQHTSAILALTTHATTAATASQGGVARVWSAENGQELHGYYAPTSQPIRAAAFSVSGSLALGGDDGRIALWQQGQRCLHQVEDVFGWHCLDQAVVLEKQMHPVRSLAFTPDGKWLAAGGDDRQLILLPMRTSLPLLIHPQQEIPVALSWSPAGPLLAGALGARVVLWHLQGEG